MPPQCQVRTIELEDNAGPGDQVVFGFHRVSQGVEVGFLIGIVIVGEEQRNNPRRCCGHERGVDSRIGQRALEAPDIGLDSFGTTECHGADARGRRDFQLDRACKIREVGEVGQCQRRRRSIESGQAFPHVGRIAKLACLAIADNVDAHRALALDDIAHGLVEQPRQILIIAANRCVPVDGDEQILNMSRTRKTSGVRRQDAIVFLQHDPSIPVQRISYATAQGRWHRD